MSLLSFAPTILKNLFIKPATQLYPEKEKEYCENTRGSIDIDIDNCIFCGICAKKCPTDAITVNKQEKSWSIDRFACLACSYCVECCPKKCLKVNNYYTKPSEEKYLNSFIKEDKEN